jgi:hypothetical protein
LGGPLRDIAGAVRFTHRHQAFTNKSLMSRQHAA